MQYAHKAVFIGGPKAGQILMLEKELHSIRVPILTRPRQLLEYWHPQTRS